VKRWLSFGLLFGILALSLGVSFVPRWLWEHRLDTLSREPQVIDIKAVELALKDPQNGRDILLSELNLSDEVFQAQSTEWIKAAQVQLLSLSKAMGWDLGVPKKWEIFAQPYIAASLEGSAILWMVECRIEEISGYVRLWLDEEARIVGLEIRPLGEAPAKDAAETDAKPEQSAQTPDISPYTQTVLLVTEALTAMYGNGENAEEITRLEMVDGICEFTIHLGYVTFCGRLSEHFLVLDPQEMELSAVKGSEEDQSTDGKPTQTDAASVSTPKKEKE